MAVLFDIIIIFFFPQRFIQYLASRNTLFNLSNFLDKSGLQGKKQLIHYRKSRVTPFEDYCRVELFTLEHVLWRNLMF